MRIGVSLLIIGLCLETVFMLPIDGNRRNNNNEDSENENAWSKSSSSFEPFCSLCHFTFEVINNLLRSKLFFDMVDWLAKNICPLLYDEEICIGSTMNYLPALINNLIEKVTYKEFLCSYLKLCSNPRLQLASKSEYEERILKGKPPPSRPPFNPHSQKIKMLVFTDPHIDFKYKEGKKGVCKENICCRQGENAQNKEEYAGMFGYMGKCDLPLATMKDFLEREIERNSPDIIIYLGDAADHNTMDQPRGTHLLASKYIADKLSQKYPHAGQVYPVIGNHEGLPVDDYDVWGNQSNWIQEGLVDMWGQWLLPQSAKSVKERGCYSQKHGESNLRIIVLNPWVYSAMNAYIWKNATDPWGHLDWLYQELLSAEDKKEDVIILGHIPPSAYSAVMEWGYRFGVIVDRFSNNIRGLLFGHTHRDTWQLIGSASSPTPAGVIQVVPPLTTFKFLNPSYRIYILDANTSTFLDSFTYRLYLHVANYLRSPLWTLAYSFAHTYHLQSLEPAQFLPITERIKTDDSLYEVVLKYIYAEGTDSTKDLHNKEVQMFWYCFFRYGNYWDIDACCNSKYPVSGFTNYIASNHWLLYKWRYLIYH